MNNTVNKLIQNSSWLSGNITPISWYQYIRTAPTKTKPTGSPDAIAVSIMSDIMYWYRPTEIRDEATGNVIGYKEKFAADKLQKTYQSYAELFGVSKKKIKQSFDLLVELGLITREFRTVDFESGLKLNNVMFIEPIIEKVFKISTSGKDSGTPSPPKRVPPSPPKKVPSSDTKGGDKYKEYTEITNNDVPKPNSKVDPPEPSSFSETHLTTVLTMLMSMVPEQFQKPSVKKTLERGLNSHSPEYIRLAVLYAVTTSTADTWQKFKSYLGQCIDKNWHDGWQPEINRGNKTQSLDFSKIPDKNLKFLADAGNHQAIEELKRRESGGDI